MQGHSFERLKAHILGLSEAADFDVARKEWRLVCVEITDEFDECPCGQEIKEQCYIQNTINNNQTYVGNVCINRFIKIDTGTLFAGIKRIRENIFANANDAVIDYAQRLGYLYGENEVKFLRRTTLSRNLTEKQRDWKAKINRRILEKIVVKTRGQIVK